MIRDFDPFTFRILSAFNPNKPINVVGSQRLRGSYFSNDFDQFQQVHLAVPMDALILLRNAILSLRSIPNVRVPEIKWSGRNMNPQTFLRSNPAKLLNELAYSKGTVKLDAIAWIDSSARFAEFSCVYEFVLNGTSLNPPEPHLKSLRNDIQDFKKQGKFFKAMKRIAALKRAQNKSTEEFDLFFNGDYGLLYSVLNDLNTLDSLPRYSKRKRQIELDNVFNRLGGVQLHSKVLQSILDEIKQGNIRKALPLIEFLVNRGAFEWLRRKNYL